MGPTLLKSPETIWTSPEKTLTLRAHEIEVHGRGVIQIVKRSPDIQQVEVVPHAKLEDTQIVKNSVA